MDPMPGSWRAAVWMAAGSSSVPAHNSALVLYGCGAVGQE